MICRIWRGWATKQNAEKYQEIVLNKVIPRIEDMKISGFRHIDVLRRDVDGEVEFTTIMWFDSLDSVKAFMGEDYTASHVPPEAREVLARFDAHSAHHEIIDRRPQSVIHEMAP